MFYSVLRYFANLQHNPEVKRDLNRAIDICLAAIHNSTCLFKPTN
jgi:hypothetical protein